MAARRSRAWVRSRAGVSNHWRSARLPMPVRQLSSSESRVGASSPRRVWVSSRLRWVAWRQVDQFAGAQHGQALDVGQGAALGVLQIGQQRAAGGLGQGQVLGVEPLQAGHAQLFAQAALAQRGVELPGWALGLRCTHRGQGLGQAGHAVVARQQDLGGVQAHQPAGQLGAAALQQADLALAQR